MKQVLHKIGKFYSNIMINMIGIFIFTGLLSVFFGTYGWLPNPDIYAISQFVYTYAVPLLIAYTAGNQMGRVHKPDDPNLRTSGIHHAGGAIAVLAVSGMILADEHVAILGAMIVGPICGFFWKQYLEPWTRKVKPGLEMLVRNLAAALTGVVAALVAYDLIAPGLRIVVNILMLGLNWLIAHRLLCLASIIIEPAKVFFLNNSINHGILLPLAMQQVEKAGSSLLFLLETNPGPGCGVLLAYWLCKRKQRKKYAAYLFVELVGGIHEIYFPEVLANLWMLLPLIGGGVTGTFFFSVFQAKAAGAVSPGSVVTVLLMTGHHAGAALAGVLASTLVSAFLAYVILKVQQQKQENYVPVGKREEDTMEQVIEQIASREAQLQNKQKVESGKHKIGFVCDAGVGSSAMGAGLLRRTLKEAGINGIPVEYYAVDQVPPDLSLAVCQKDFLEILKRETSLEQIYTMESLLDPQEHRKLVEQLKEECGNG